MNNITDFLEKNKIKNISYDNNFYNLVKLNGVECIFLLEDFYTKNYQLCDYDITIIAEKDTNGFYYIDITKNESNNGLEFYINAETYNKLIKMLESELVENEI